MVVTAAIYGMGRGVIKMNAGYFILYDIAEI